MKQRRIQFSGRFRVEYTQPLYYNSLSSAALAKNIFAFVCTEMSPYQLSPYLTPRIKKIIRLHRQQMRAFVVYQGGNAL